MNSKKLIALGIMALLLFPLTLQAAAFQPEDIAPADSLGTFDFRLTGKIKKLLQPLSQKEMEH